MTDRPISLSKYRKARVKRDKRQRADENAVRFGRSKLQKIQESQCETRAKTRLEQHRRDNNTAQKTDDNTDF